MKKSGIKAIVAITIEWVGPLCISDPVKKSKIMSISGSIERTRSRGRLSFTCIGFDEPLPNRYAIAMCPTANKAVFLLKTQTLSLLGY